MLKSELKKIIRETVKDCIREVLLENEIFSSLIREVIISTKNSVLESKTSYGKITESRPSKEVYESVQKNFDRDISKFDKQSEPVKKHEQFSNPFEEKEAINEEFSSIRGLPNSGDAMSYINEVTEASNVVPLDTIKAMLGMN